MVLARIRILRIRIQSERRWRGRGLGNYLQGKDIAVGYRRIAFELIADQLLRKQLLERGESATVSRVVLNLDGGKRLNILARRGFVACLLCVSKSIDGYTNQNPDDRDHDHEFDQSESGLPAGVVIASHNSSSNQLT